MARLPSIRSISVAVVLSAIASLAQAAPGPFQVTGSWSCSGYVPATYFEWTTSAGATSYELIRDDGQHIAVDLVNAASDTNVVVGGPARAYFVRATDGNGTTDSNTVIVAPPPTPCSPPPAPFTITGKALCYPGDPKHSMAPAEQLDWPNARYATSYDIYRNDSFYHAIAGGGSLYTFIGFPVVGGPTNSYYIVAKNAAGTTASNTVTFPIPADICVTEPPVPVLSPATLFCSTTHEPAVSLHWTVVPAAFGWQLYRDGSPYAAPHGLSYNDTNVVPGHTYTYNIATYGLGAPLSNPVTVTVLNEACSPGLSPDLAAIDIKPSASSGRVGDTITVNVELANRGNALARASTARVRFGRGPSMSSSDPVLATIALPSVEFGADIQRTATIKLPAVATGTYYFFLTLDEEHFSGEDRMDDNVKASAAFILGEMIQPRRRAAGH